MQKVRPKKSLGQHFLTDKDIAARIVDSLKVPEGASIAEDVLEVGPGTGVLTGLLLKRSDINLKMVELDPEAKGRQGYMGCDRGIPQRQLPRNGRPAFGSGLPQAEPRQPVPRVILNNRQFPI